MTFLQLFIKKSSVNKKKRPRGEKNDKEESEDESQRDEDRPLCIKTKMDTDCDFLYLRPSCSICA